MNNGIDTKYDFFDRILATAVSYGVSTITTSWISDVLYWISIIFCVFVVFQVYKFIKFWVFVTIQYSKMKNTNLTADEYIKQYQKNIGEK